MPQLSGVLGPCAGGAVYSPAITDFVFMVESTSHMFITGPDVIRAVTHEEVTKEELGGAAAHVALGRRAPRLPRRAGAASRGCATLLSFLPQNNREDPPRLPTRDRADRADPALDELIPRRSGQAVRHARAARARRRRRRAVRDPARARAQHRGRRSRASTGGRWAWSPTSRRTWPGCLDIDASVKAARFVRFCDCFNIPLVTFVDVPGFLPGTAQEWGGIIKHGAKLLYAFAEATVPKLTVITRKAYGGAYDVMSSKHIRGDLSFAYPSAEIAVMGPEAAVNIVFREELAKAADPDAARARYRQRVPREAGQPLHGGVARLRRRGDPPARDPRHGCAARSPPLANKRDTNPPKKHGNIPL